MGLGAVVYVGATARLGALMGVGAKAHLGATVGLGAAVGLGETAHVGTAVRIGTLASIYLSNMSALNLLYIALKYPPNGESIWLLRFR